MKSVPCDDATQLSMVRRMIAGMSAAFAAAAGGSHAAAITPTTAIAAKSEGGVRELSKFSLVFDDSACAASGRRHRAIIPWSGKKSGPKAACGITLFLVGQPRGSPLSSTVSVGPGGEFI
jgi:hypothetical protein